MRADDRNGGLYENSSGDGIAQVPPVESTVEQEGDSRGKDRYFPRQSAKCLLKDFFELKPPAHLDSGHSTTSFSADQKIQFARAVELEVSLASYGLLEDLLLKARVGGAGQPVASCHSIWTSPYPSVAGSGWGDSAASRTKYSLPISTEVHASNNVAAEGSL